METKGNFYLGRIFNPANGETTQEPLLYDPDDLTTHAVVVGMTGSGKTGLCIDLLEEAALNGIPSLMIDPKGDITNMLLHFPALSPSDFKPWVNLDDARRDGKTPDQAAEAAANLWRKGLKSWDIGSDRIRALQESAHFAIYTPGSDAGIPVSILSSLKAPDIPWENNRELLQETISGTVTAILGLVGMDDIDPVRSREHILLANIFEHAWRSGRDLDLGELIMQTQSPPFKKLGVFDVDMFFPQKDRFELAMLLNNILASPAFQSWIEGQPLNIPELLYGEDGKPRHSVFYIAHLTDEERMFFVTLLYSAIESWMRSQSGTSSLRAIVYFDEIFGYLPPVSNPPSKEIMLRMLKQGRAFGVGQMLVTQNPVDLDYKALSNTGTWFIGKLQTEQDKERLLDGLEGASSGTLDRNTYDGLISGLGKRVFLLHNVHEKEPVLFYTRWAMNYLTGPLTRTQIPALNKLVGAKGPVKNVQPDRRETNAGTVDTGSTATESFSPSGISTGKDELQNLGSRTRPALSSRIDEYFLPNNLTLTQAFRASNQPLPADAKALGLLYRPVLLAQANIEYLNRKYKLNYERQHTVLISNPDRRGRVRWEDFIVPSIDPRDLDRNPDPQARFAPLESPFQDVKTMSAMKKDFLDWAYYESEVSVRANETLKVFAGPDVSEEDFRKLCTQASREARDNEIRKISKSYAKKLDVIENRMEREERELEEDREELSQRKMEEWGTHAENVLSLFGGRRRRISTSLSKRRMTQKAKADVDESLEAIEDYKKDMEELEERLKEEIKEISDRWNQIANDISEIPVKPYKKDVQVDLFGVAWFPYHLVKVGEKIIEMPGFTTK
jgi:hypothetical protein